ncbi:MAG: amidohydrolase [Saprospiraceae bacterium]|nr:MAG: amidohydrolase [Saprospiraceae bacterium]
MVDVKKGALLKDTKDIYIRGNRITGIATHANRYPKPDTKVIDGSGKYIIPGLWDMHAHPDDPEMWRMPPDAASRDLLLPLFVLYGVTGIRDMAGSMETIKAWKTNIKKKELLGPEVFACGPLLDGPNPMWDGSVGIASLDKVRIVVDSLKATGADFLKVYSLLPDSTYFELSRYAKSIHFPFVGHVPFTVTTVEASITGMKSQEHLLNLLIDCSTVADQIYNNTLDYGDITDALDKYIFRNNLIMDTYDPQKAKAIFKVFVQNKTWHTPTISMWYKNAYFEEEVKKDSIYYPYLPQYMRKYWQPEVNDHLQRRSPEIIDLKKRLVSRYLQVINKMNEAGVKLLAGTDMGANPLCFPGISLHNELALLVEAGLTPAEALKTATINPALFLEVEKDYGTVTKGKVADLVILDENPLEDITNTRKIFAVVRNGEVLSAESIKAELKAIEYIQADPKD